MAGGFDTTFMVIPDYEDRLLLLVSPEIEDHPSVTFIDIWLENAVISIPVGVN